MIDQHKDAGSEKPVVCDHNWLFGTLIGWQPCQSDLLRLSFSDEQLALIDPDRTGLLSANLRSPELRERSADTVIEVAGAHGGDKLAVRCLLEHKSQFNERELMRQLLRYQTGLYERAWSPVVTVVINNGAPLDKHVLRFRDQLESTDKAFLRALRRHGAGLQCGGSGFAGPGVSGAVAESRAPLGAGVVCDGTCVWRAESGVAG